MEDISFLDQADVRIAEEVGLMVVGVPIGTEEYVGERAMGIVKDGNASAWCAASLTCWASK